jgi:hypothetical protein
MSDSPLRRHIRPTEKRFYDKTKSQLRSPNRRLRLQLVFLRRCGYRRSGPDAISSQREAHPGDVLRQDQPGTRFPGVRERRGRRHVVRVTHRRLPLHLWQSPGCGAVRNNKEAFRPSGSGRGTTQAGVVFCSRRSEIRQCDQRVRGGSEGGGTEPHQKRKESHQRN